MPIVTTSLTLKIIVSCEGCGNEFVVEKMLQGQTISTGGTSTTKLQKESYAQVKDQLDSIREKVQKGDYSFIPRQSCPKCLYLQSYMVKNGKKWVQIAVAVGIILLLPTLIGVHSFQDAFLWSGTCLAPMLIAWGLAYLVLVHPNYFWLKRHHYPKGERPLEKAPQVVFPSLD